MCIVDALQKVCSAVLLKATQYTLGWIRGWCEHAWFTAIALQGGARFATRARMYDDVAGLVTWPVSCLWTVSSSVMRWVGSGALGS